MLQSTLLQTLMHLRGVYNIVSDLVTTHHLISTSDSYPWYFLVTFAEYKLAAKYIFWRHHTEQNHILKLFSKGLWGGDWLPPSHGEPTRPIRHLWLSAPRCSRLAYNKQDNMSDS